MAAIVHREPDVVLVCGSQLRAPWSEVQRRLREPQARAAPPDPTGEPALLLVESDTHPVDVARSLEQGADDVIRLEVPASELLARIRRAMRQRRAVGELRHALKEDELTGLGNRRDLADRERELAARMEREGGAVLCTACDLDRFKQVNDTYGHEIGDAALCWTAARLREHCRASDHVFRLGGDEFLILAPNPSPQHRADLGRRLQRALRLAPMSVHTPQGSPHMLSLSLSVGTAVWRPPQDLSEAIARADHRLLEAKRSLRTAGTDLPDREAPA